MSPCLDFPIARVFRFSIGILVLLAPSAALADPSAILVPAYFYPTTSNDWNRLDAAASQVPLTAILNPASGPDGSADPNYVTAVNKLRAAGGNVIGYVDTDYGSVSLATAEAEIAKYPTLYNVNGIFIDRMANTASEISYYATLYNFAKSLNPAYQVIGNPGTNTLEGYLTTPTADVLVTFEGTGAAYASATPASWTFKYSSNHFANLVYDVPTASEMLTDIALAGSRNVGNIYVTDNSSTSNPYSRLPSYWDQEVAAVAASSMVPEPASLTMLAIGFCSLAVVRPIRTARKLRARIGQPDPIERQTNQHVMNFVYAD